MARDDRFLEEEHRNRSVKQPRGFGILASMILKNINSIEKQIVTMAGAEKVQMQLLCGPADGCPTFAMRKFIVAPGGCTPKHQHDYEHEVLVLSGEGVVFGNGKEQPIKSEQ